MALPITQQIEDQSEETKDKIRRLQAAYEEFDKKWNDIEEDEQKLVDEIRGVMDKGKMYDILHTIHSIKE